MKAEAVNEINPVLDREDDDITFHPDSINLKQIFPVEIWEIITTKFVERSHSVDLKSFSNSAPFFRNQLAPHKTIFLFENAFQYTSLTIWKNEGIEGLSVKDILKCREICSHWNTAVDKLICEKFQYVRNNYEKVNFQAPVGEAFRKVLRNEFSYRRPGVGQTLAVVKFIQCFQETHSLKGQIIQRSPFIGTNLSISFPKYEERHHARHWSGISTVLCQYGSYIENLTLSIENNIDFFADRQTTRRWLLQLPNLTKLQIFCDVTRIGPTGDRVESWFPKLKNLESLVTSRFPGRVFNQLIRSNNHVSTLIIRRWEANCDFFTFSLPNLRNLEIESDSVELIGKLNAPQVQWSLEYLKVDFGYGIYSESAALFQMIQEKFANTLVYLSLSANIYNLGNESLVSEGFKNGRLDLPKLKKIELYVNGMQVCLDFLLPMRKSLEEIKVIEGYIFPFAGNVTATSGDIVQFSGFEGKMMNSNIWVIFKVLRKIEVVTNLGTVQKVYFRKDWAKGNDLYDV